MNALIPGIDIQVTAADATGTGDGALGISSAQLTLSIVAQTIISGIGSAYTGDGINNGHNLTYALALDGTGAAAYEDLEATTTAVATVTYTISDN